VLLFDSLLLVVTGRVLLSKPNASDGFEGDISDPEMSTDSHRLLPCPEVQLDNGTVRGNTNYIETCQFIARDSLALAVWG
jgi:hypothetical protein